MPKCILSHKEFCDSIITDCNASIQMILSGNYIGWCKKMVDIVQKVSALSQGIEEEAESNKKKIEVLKQQLRNAGANIKDVALEELNKKEGGATSGSDRDMV